MSTVERQLRRIDNIKQRIARPKEPSPRCALYPCENPTTAHAREGLNRNYCRKHIEFYRRHGSYTKRSYGAGELRPYRLRAMHWLRQHREDADIDQAVEAVDRLYRLGGRPVEAFRLAGMTPTERAKAVWAKLRKEKVDPLEVLAAWMSVDMRVRDDMQADRHEEYRHVQGAKLIHRMAGGSHKRWDRVHDDGSLEVTKLHRYPVSRGVVLRMIGKNLADACRSLNSDAAAQPHLGTR